MSKRFDVLLVNDGRITPQVIEKLRSRGLTSPYLRSFVVARINPLRFVKAGKDEKSDFDKTIDKMIEGAKKFDASKVKAQDIALAATVGGGDDGTN